MKKLILIATIISIAAIASAAERDFSPDEMAEIIMSGKGGALEDPETALKPGDAFRDFELPDLAGNIIKTENLRQDKIFIVRLVNLHDVFSVTQRRIFEDILQEHRDKIAIMDIIAKEDEHTLEVVFNEYEASQITYTVVLDKKGVMAEKYGIKVTPAVLVFDKEGKYFLATRLLSSRSFNAVFKELTEKAAPEKK